MGNRHQPDINGTTVLICSNREGIDGEGGRCLRHNGGLKFQYGLCNGDVAPVIFGRAGGTDVDQEFVIQGVHLIGSCAKRTDSTMPMGKDAGPASFEGRGSPRDKTFGGREKRARWLRRGVTVG
jgi:hypothetical protein